LLHGTTTASYSFATRFGASIIDDHWNQLVSPSWNFRMLRKSSLLETVKG
jgi:hypothetical protein